MNFICLSCGQINENNTSGICSNCQTQLNKEFYLKIKDYAKRAVHYGYDYRVEYESQVEIHGEVKVKASQLTTTCLRYGRVTGKILVILNYNVWFRGTTRGFESRPHRKHKRCRQCPWDKFD